MHACIIEEGENIKMSTNRESQTEREEEGVGEESRGKRQEFGTSNYEAKKGESREGPSNFRSDP